MTRLLAINESNYGSTGKIMRAVAEKSGLEYRLAVSNSRSNKNMPVDNTIYIGTRLFRNIHLFLYNNTGLNGYFSIVDTFFFLRKVKRYKPDIIHLHNLHNCYINLPMLFSYIKKHDIKVVWTLHDCWSFTGQCPHFTISECFKWKEGCNNCKSIYEYPACRVDNTELMWKKKKQWFTGVDNLTIVTPSKWLSNLVGYSFLGEYTRRVINNGIDLDIIKPVQSEFRKKHNINKYLILGVAFDWGYKKGLDVFNALSDCLPEQYTIVLVGTNAEVDRLLPHRIVSIHRTSNQNELAEIYSEASVFVNPTREDTFPTVNIEALACGTPVITNCIGGCPEIIDSLCGRVIDTNDIELLRKSIINICEGKIIKQEDCLERAQMFSDVDRYKEYKLLFDEVLSDER